MNWLTLILVATTLGIATVPAAEARILPSTLDMDRVEAPPVISYWLGRSVPVLLGGQEAADPTSAAAARMSQRVLVTLHPLGDIDHDGKAEILLQSVDLATRASSYQAMAGPQLEDVVWKVDGIKNRALGAVADIDADGILDPLVVTAIEAGGSISNQAVGPATTQTGRITQQVSFTPLGGLGGQARFDAVLHQELSVTSTSSALGTALAGGENKTTQVVGQLNTAGRGLFASFDNTWNTTRTSALVAVQNARQTTVEADAIVRVLDLRGQVMAVITLRDPNVNPLEIATNELLLDGTTQVLALSLSKVGQSEELPAGVPRVQAFTDAGQLLWTVELDALAGTPMLLPSLADVDADGKVDVGVLEHRLAADLRSIDSRFVLLSGAMGHVKGTLSTPGAALAVVPFGAAKSKGDMLLAVAESSTDRALQVTAVAGEDLGRVWELPLTPGSLPLNAVVDPVTGNLQGFTDLTRDGTPDLLVGLGGPARAGLAKGLELTLYSGADGKVVWTRHLASAAAATILNDAGAATTVAKKATTGLPAPAPSGLIAVVSKAGPEAEIHSGLDVNASLELTTYELATGHPLWRLTVLKADQAADLSPKLLLVPTLTPVGDVDGDGTIDVDLRLEHRLDGNLTGLPVGSAGLALDGSAETVAHHYLVSGERLEPLWTQSDELVNGSSPRVPLPAPSELSPREAGKAESEGGRSSAAPFAWILATATLVLLFRRRR